MFWRHRHLISQLTKREVVGRYRGSILGLLWSFLHPLLMLIVYLFVFSFVFKVKWGIQIETGEVEFGVVLFAGLIVHTLFTECLVRSPSIIKANTQFVKKIVFPLEILPIVIVYTALFHLLIGFLILLAFNTIAHQVFHWTLIYVPVVLLPLVVLSLGVAWLLASIGIFIRDVSHIVGILSTVLLFLSPIFYPLTLVPEHLRLYLYLNPLTLIVQELRAVVIYGHSPDWFALFIYTMIAVLILILGYRWFKRTQPMFADVL